MFKRLSFAALVLIAAATPALAHLDPDQHGSLLAGVSHPLFGLDHILAMIAVGLWAALLGFRSQQRTGLWLVPLAFVGTMILGFAAAVAGAPLPFVEPVILASVVVIGLSAAIALHVPTWTAMFLVGFFAFFHGHAHGGELGAAGAILFGTGFALSTALLHALGIGLGLQFKQLFGGQRGQIAIRALGGAAALGGLWLAIGV